MLSAVPKRGALLPIAPVVGRLTLRAMVGLAQALRLLAAIYDRGLRDHNVRSPRLGKGRYRQSLQPEKGHSVPGEVTAMWSIDGC